MSRHHRHFGLLAAVGLLAPFSMAQPAGPAFVLVEDHPLMAARASTGGIAWVDYDGDGDDDAFVANGYDVSAGSAAPQMNQLYENVAGRLLLRDSVLSKDAAFSSASAWADFDNDGLIDVFVPNQRGQNNLLYRNVGNGAFQLLDEALPTRDRGSSFAATWGDVDGDGFVDLVVTNGGLSGAGPDFLYRNNRGVFERGTMGPVVEGSRQPGGPTFVDYDLDGDIDLFVPGARNRMYRNDGRGSFALDDRFLFASEGQLGLSVSGAWADYDNDGDFDLFQVPRNGQPRRMYVNDGDYRFRSVDIGDATRDVSEAFHSLWVDVDNDGFQDLVIANWGAPAHVYRNRAGELLERVVLGELGERDWHASMVASADFDQDGDLDLVVGNWPSRRGDGEANLLYRNDSPVGNWLAIRLRGTRSNASAIGARVEVELRDGTLVREVRSQDGWRSQSSLELHFGLGTRDAVRNVRIHWPAGGVQELGPMRAGQRRTIVESTTASARIVRPAPQAPPEAAPAAPTVPARPAVSQCDLTVDARTEAGSLLVTGTVRLPIVRRTSGAAVRFRLLANASELEVGIIDDSGVRAPRDAEQVGSFGGSGLRAVRVWEVDLVETQLTGDEAVLWFSFAVTGTQSIFHVDRGLAFASGLNLPWYPQAASVTKALGKLTILTPPAFSAAAAGRRTSTAEDEAEGRFVFQIDTPSSPSFAVSKWHASTYTGGSVPVHMFRESPHRDSLSQARRIAEIIELLEREFGPYPYPEFSIVEVPGAVANDAGFGGVSLDGWMIALGPAWHEELAISFFAHEIAHQWWGNRVRPRRGSIPDGLLDEGIAQFAGHVIVNELLDSSAARRHRKFGSKLLGWPVGALGYFAQVAAGEDRSLEQLMPSRATEWLKDNKLAFVWLELQRVLGEEGLRKGLHELFRRHAGGSASYGDVISALEHGAEVNPGELQWFFEQWMRRPGAPELGLSWHQAGEQLRLELTQPAPAYRLEVPIRIHGRNGATLDESVRFDDLTANYSLDCAGLTVWHVEIDPEYTFLHLTPELRAAAAPMGYYLRALSERDLSKSLALIERGQECIPHPDRHAAGMFLEYARGTVHGRHGQWTEAKEHLLAAVQCPTRRADFLPSVYLSLAEAAIQLQDRSLFDWSRAAIIAADAAAGRVTSAPSRAERLEFPSSGAGAGR